MNESKFKLLEVYVLKLTNKETDKMYVDGIYETAEQAKECATIGQRNLVWQDGGFAGGLWTLESDKWIYVVERYPVEYINEGI